MLTALVYALAQSTHRLLFVAFNLSFLKEFANYNLGILVRNPKEFSTVLEMHEGNILCTNKQSAILKENTGSLLLEDTPTSIWKAWMRKEIEGNCE